MDILLSLLINHSSLVYVIHSMKFFKTWVELRGSSTKEIQFVKKKNTIIAIDINLERGK